MGSCGSSTLVNQADPLVESNGDDTSSSWLWIVVAVSVVIVIAICILTIFCIRNKKMNESVSVGDDGATLRDNQQLKTVDSQIIEIEVSVEEDGVTAGITTT